MCIRYINVTPSFLEESHKGTLYGFHGLKPPKDIKYVGVSREEYGWVLREDDPVAEKLAENPLRYED